MVDVNRLLLNTNDCLLLNDGTSYFLLQTSTGDSTEYIDMIEAVVHEIRRG